MCILLLLTWSLLCYYLLLVCFAALRTCTVICFRILLTTFCNYNITTPVPLNIVCFNIIDKILVMCQETDNNVSSMWLVYNKHPSFAVCAVVSTKMFHSAPIGQLAWQRAPIAKHSPGIASTLHWAMSTVELHQEFIRSCDQSPSGVQPKSIRSTDLVMRDLGLKSPKQNTLIQYFWLQENHIKDFMDTLPLQHRVT